MKMLFKILLKKIQILGIFMLCLYNISFISFGDEPCDVVINSDVLSMYSPKEVHQVMVSLNNPNLYNENLFLSYHVYNSDGKALLFEGVRVPLQFNNDMYSDCSIEIDLTSINTSKKQKIIISFDIIDEKNKYWFSNNSSIKMHTFDIIYENNYWKSIKKNITEEIYNHPYIFFLNTICFLSIIFFIIKYFKYREE